MRTKLLIIGNGMASVRLVEHLVRIAPDQFAITIVGAEPEAGYNRVLLSALLANDINQDAITLRERSWYEAQGISLITGDVVARIDATTRSATLQSGLTLAFDNCVLATGSHPVLLPVPGMDKKGVMAFRNLSDVTRLADAALAGKKIAVIGGGLLGIEAAYGLAKRGADVTLVHVMERLMERQLDAPAASLVRKALERRGVKVLLQKQTAEVLGDDAVTGLRFADGMMLETDLLVCAVGIRPNTDLALAGGLKTNRGILVDDSMQTSQSGIYAIGECAEHRGIAYGLVEPAYAQAQVLAHVLIEKTAAFEGMVLATNLKVSGLPVFSAGAFMGGAELQSIHIEDRVNRRYRKIILDGNRLVGCIMVGEADDALWYLELIRKQVDISSVRNRLIHGRIFAESLLASPEDRKAA